MDLVWFSGVWGFILFINKICEASNIPSRLNVSFVFVRDRKIKEMRTQAKSMQIKHIFHIILYNNSFIIHFICIWKANCQLYIYITFPWLSIEHIRVAHTVPVWFVHCCESQQAFHSLQCKRHETQQQICQWMTIGLTIKIRIHSKKKYVHKNVVIIRIVLLTFHLVCLSCAYNRKLILIYKFDIYAYI